MKYTAWELEKSAEGEKKSSQSQIFSDCSISSVKGVITETPNL